jgi:hypothetical protein
LESIDGIDFVESHDTVLSRQPAVDNEDLLLNGGCKGQLLKESGEDVHDLFVVLVLDFAVKAVDLVHISSNKTK